MKFIISRLLASRNNVESIIELKHQLHKDEVIKILERGFILIPSEEDPSILIRKKLNREDFYSVICEKVIRPDKNYAPKTYFERVLFRSMTLEQIWVKYHLRHTNLL